MGIRRPLTSDNDTAYVWYTDGSSTYTIAQIIDTDDNTFDSCDNILGNGGGPVVFDLGALYNCDRIYFKASNAAYGTQGGVIKIEAYYSNHWHILFASDAPTGVLQSVPISPAQQIQLIKVTPDIEGILDGMDLFTLYANEVVSPTITPPLVPATGSTGGGTAVTITGTGFQASPAVTFGGVSATSIVRVSATQITCVTPAHAAGAVNVVITNTDTGTVTSTNAFTYEVPVVVVADVGNFRDFTNDSTDEKWSW